MESVENLELFQVFEGKQRSVISVAIGDGRKERFTSGEPNLVY